MGMQFASSEWCDQWFSALRTGDDVRRSGAGWAHGPMLLVVEADPEANLASDVAFRLFVHEGELRELSTVDPRSAGPVPFTIRGGYQRWKALTQAGHDVVATVRDGRLAFHGDLPQLGRASDLLSAVLAAAGRIDTSWPDDVAAPEPARAAAR